MKRNLYRYEIIILLNDDDRAFLLKTPLHLWFGQDETNGHTVFRLIVLSSIILWVKIQEV